MIRRWNGKMPRVHPEAYVNEMAYVVGDVEVGEGSTVWPFAVLRGDEGRIVIGRNTHIQDGSVVHSNPDEVMEIGNHINVGHSVVIHADRIGDHCLIGNNATLLEGVEVGQYCLVGANAMVLQGTKVPPYSFVVGVPAQIHPLADEQKEMLDGVADGFAGTAR